MSNATGQAEFLLAQARLMKDKYDALAANGQRFNIFRLLGRETDEVYTHSAILADLLDPNGSHGQGVGFLRLFARWIRLSEDELGTAKVWVEAALDSRSRLDVLIETDRSCIVIENKIHADDRDTQLQRYHEIASTRGKRFEIFYLTLRGRRPSKKSLGDLAESEVTLISYDKVVIAWLDECIKEAALIPAVRETLRQYRATVMSLTETVEGSLGMELKELLKAKHGESYNFQLAPAIADAYRQLSIEVEWTFWQKLRDRLRGVAEQGWRLELDGPGGGSDCFKTVSERVVRNAHRNAQKKWNYGWTFEIRSELSRFDYDDQRILLRVECDEFGWVFLGLAAVEEGGGERRWLRPSTDESLPFEQWAPWLAALPDDGWRTDYGWRLGWRYPTAPVVLSKNDSFTLEPDVMARLLEDGAVDPLVNEIRASVDRVVKASTSSGQAERQPH